MGYTRHTIRGFSWQTFFMVAATAITTIKIAILARLLGPHDFGMYSLIVIGIGLSESITETGINVTILQAEQSLSYFLNTAWVISIVRGIGIAILMTLLGVAMAWFYHEPSLSFWVALAALNPLIKGWINPAIISLYKNLHFFRDSLYRFSLILVEATATTSVAYFTHSVAAFIVGLLVVALFEVCMSFLFFRTRPQFEYVKSRAAIIFGNAKGLSIGAALSYLNDNIDNFFVGKILGISPLGIYQNAYALSHKPTYGIAQSLSHSTLPIYTKMTSNPARLKRAFIRSKFALLGLMIVISSPLFIAPTYLVNLLLGEKWLQVIPCLRWLIGAGILHGLADTTYALFIATHNYFAMNTHRVMVVILFLPLLFWLGGTHGLVGAAQAVFIARLLSLPLLLWYSWRTIHR